MVFAITAQVVGVAVDTHDDALWTVHDGISADTYVSVDKVPKLLVSESVPRIYSRSRVFASIRVLHLDLIPNFRHDFDWTICLLAKTSATPQTTFKEA